MYLRKFEGALIFAALFSSIYSVIKAAVVYEQAPNTVDLHCPASLLSGVPVFPVMNAVLVAAFFAAMMVVAAFATVALMFKFFQIEETTVPERDIESGCKSCNSGLRWNEKFIKDLKTAAVYYSS